MSETHDYPMSLKIEMTGVDTVQYAVVSADTILPLQVGMSGINAVVVSLFDIQPVVEVDMSAGGMHRAIAISDCADNIREQLAAIGTPRINNNSDSLRLRLARRGSRSFPIRLDSVDFTFADQYGLYGQPIVEPKTVTLYGDDSLLATIDAVQLQSTRIEGVNATTTYKLKLDKKWMELGDIHTDVDEATLYLPVEQFIERVYNVPVELDTPDTTLRLRLYPESVKVCVWIAQCDIDRNPDFRVTINYEDILAGNTHVTPRLEQFPAWLRPRSIEPAQVQCVLIK